MADETKTRADVTCPGCGRPELHKLCPAHGTPYYMSGVTFTREMEERIKAQEADGHPIRIVVTYDRRFRIAAYVPDPDETDDDAEMEAAECHRVAYGSRCAVKAVWVEAALPGFRESEVLTGTVRGSMPPIRTKRKDQGDGETK